MLKADLKPSPWRKTAEKVCRSLSPEVALSTGNVAYPVPEEEPGRCKG